MCWSYVSPDGAVCVFDSCMAERERKQRSDIERGTTAIPSLARACAFKIGNVLLTTYPVIEDALETPETERPRVIVSEAFQGKGHLAKRFIKSTSYPMPFTHVQISELNNWLPFSF